jgi:hypothetical protein
MLAIAAAWGQGGGTWDQMLEAGKRYGIEPENAAKLRAALLSCDPPLLVKLTRVRYSLAPGAYRTENGRYTQGP